MRMPEPRPLGETSFRAIVRAIVFAEPMKVRGGGWVESVFTCRTHRRLDRFLANDVRLLTPSAGRRIDQREA
jgi:hypothetical protein